MQVIQLDKKIYYDGYLKENLDIMKNAIKKDWDMVTIIDGEEGVGKSVLTQQCAYYLDPTINLSRICFTPSEFKEAILKAEKYQAVIFDEAYTGLSSRAATSRINKTLVSLLAEIRQKNLFIFIVMPTFFELDRYAALWRSRLLLHTYKGKGFQRGFFSFYNSEKKSELYMKGKKLYQYWVKPNFIGRFCKGYVVDEQEYRKKKLQATKDIDKEEQKENKKSLSNVIKRMKEKGLNLREISELLGYNYSYIKDLSRKSVG